MLYQTSTKSDKIAVVIMVPLGKIILKVVAQFPMLSWLEQAKYPASITHVTKND